MTFTEHLRAQRRSGAVLIVMGVCVSACTRREDSAPVAQGAPAAVSQRENATPEEVVRSPGEAAPQFARRIIPSGAELAFDPVEVPAGPPGSRLVILFRNSTSLSNYTGWILSPSDGDPTRYRKVVLPAMDEAAGLFDINVKAVFAAEAGGSSGPALVVLYQYYRYWHRPGSWRCGVRLSLDGWFVDGGHQSKRGASRSAERERRTCQTGGDKEIAAPSGACHAAGVWYPRWLAAPRRRLKTPPGICILTVRGSPCAA